MTLQEKITKRDALSLRRAALREEIKVLSDEIAREEADAELQAAVEAAQARHAQVIGARGIASGEALGVPG